MNTDKSGSQSLFSESVSIGGPSGAQFSSRGGRRVVIKPLDDDCLLDGELHPSIALRLERVRELPMTAVANLHGVEVIEGRASLIWDFVPGRTIESLAGEWDQARREKLRREVKLIVERMHDHGIVHGALHGRNVIIDDRGGVHVTHVSPLLHNDIEKDLAAVERIFAADGSGGALSESRIPQDQKEDEPRGPTMRGRAILGAMLALVVGLIVAASFLWYSANHS